MVVIITIEHGSWLHEELIYFNTYRNELSSIVSLAYFIFDKTQHNKQVCKGYGTLYILWWIYTLLHFTSITFHNGHRSKKIHLIVVTISQLVQNWLFTWIRKQFFRVLLCSTIVGSYCEPESKMNNNFHSIQFGLKSYKRCFSTPYKEMSKVIKSRHSTHSWCNKTRCTMTGLPCVCILWQGVVSCPVIAAWHFSVAAHWSKYHCYKQVSLRFHLRCYSNVKPHSIIALWLQPIRCRRRRLLYLNTPLLKMNNNLPLQFTTHFCILDASIIIMFKLVIFIN